MNWLTSSGSYNINSYEKRILKEYKEHQQPDSSIKVTLKNSSLLKWYIDIKGPIDSLYANEIFKLRVKFARTYPSTAPQVQFIDGKIPLHPHIYSNGHICLSLLSAEEWKPNYSVKFICHSILYMLKQSVEKKRPMDDKIYVKHSPKNPNKNNWNYEDFID